MSEGIMDDTIFIVPTFFDVDKEDLSIEFCFGPQGSPASMRVSIHAFKENGFNFVMWMTGPGKFGHGRAFTETPLKSVDYLRECLLYGKKLEEHWGKDNFWWRCSEGCTGYQYSDGPPYRVCVKCDRIRKEVDMATERWIESNPPPSLEKSQEVAVPRVLTRPSSKNSVQVHADGGNCHGTPLDLTGQCPKCKIYPDMQSTEIWDRKLLNEGAE